MFDLQFELPSGRSGAAKAKSSPSKPKRSGASCQSTPKGKRPKTGLAETPPKPVNSSDLPSKSSSQHAQGADGHDEKDLDNKPPEKRSAARPAAFGQPRTLRATLKASSQSKRAKLSDTKQDKIEEAQDAIMLDPDADMLDLEEDQDWLKGHTTKYKH